MVNKYLVTYLLKEDGYYKALTLGDFWSNNYIKYESNLDRNKSLLEEEYPNKIKPYLRDIITDLQKSWTWKIYLTIAINFIFSKDTNEEQVMYSNGNNI